MSHILRSKNKTNNNHIIKYIFLIHNINIISHPTNTSFVHSTTATTTTTTTAAVVILTVIHVCDSIHSRKMKNTFVCVCVSALVHSISPNYMKRSISKNAGIELFEKNGQRERVRKEEKNV